MPFDGFGTDSAIVDFLVRRTFPAPAVQERRAPLVPAGRTAHIVTGPGLSGAACRPAGDLVWTAVSSAQALRCAHRALHSGAGTHAGIHAGDRAVDTVVVTAAWDSPHCQLTIAVLCRAADALAAGATVLGLLSSSPERDGRPGTPVSSLAALRDRTVPVAGARDDCALYLHAVPPTRPDLTVAELWPSDLIAAAQPR